MTAFTSKARASAKAEIEKTRELIQNEINKSKDEVKKDIPAISNILVSKLLQ